MLHNYDNYVRPYLFHAVNASGIRKSEPFSGKWYLANAFLVLTMRAATKHSLALACVLATLLLVTHAVPVPNVSAASDDDSNQDDCGISTYDTYTLNQYTGPVSSHGTAQCSGTGVLSYYFHVTSENIVNLTISSPVSGILFQSLTNSPSSQCINNLPPDGGSISITMQCLYPTQECQFQYGAEFTCVPLDMYSGTVYALQSASPAVCENYFPEPFSKIAVFTSENNVIFNGTSYNTYVFYTGGGALYDDQALLKYSYSAESWQGQSEQASYEFINSENELIIVQSFMNHRCQLTYAYNGQYTTTAAAPTTTTPTSTTTTITSTTAAATTATTTKARHPQDSIIPDSAPDAANGVASELAKLPPQVRLFLKAHKSLQIINYRSIDSSIPSRRNRLYDQTRTFQAWSA